ncbi:FRIGIDA-like protein 1 [Gastrolobium bilobum]|uniref:FRIGIDA-like protein 1 n=1 Tax=Gastrolobium bilobum TaxID=150636 RepID=UPI002AAF5EC8|nr:FRIGIDA-like protein 1 [Gastrolobium bilobum]
MATLKTISAALKLVDAKIENLKKAYNDLQSHSPLLSSFPLDWSHLDSHFTSIHSTLNQRFLLLQSLESQQQQQPPNQNPNPNDPSPSTSKLPDPNPKNPNFPSLPKDPSSSSNPTTQNGTVASPSEHAVELSALCKKMDGKALRDYIADSFRDNIAIKVELQSALKCASDPAAMVFDSLDGVVGANAVSDDKDLRRLKRSCNLLLQQLRVLSPNMSFNVRKKAKALFAEWKGSFVGDNSDSIGAMAFLHFVAAYGLLSELSTNALTTFSAMAACYYDELPELYQILGLTDKVPELVQKLIDRGKHVMAVKYIFQFNLADKIPPVPILKAQVNESEKLARRLSEEGKSRSEITAREIHALRSVIRIIENHNLESEFPRASIEQRIEQLKKDKGNKKHHVPAFGGKPPQQESGIKRPRISAPAGPAAVLNNSAIHRYQQSHFQSAGLLPEHSNPYMRLPATPFGMMSTTPTPAIPPYAGPSTGPYGLDGVPMDPSGPSTRPYGLDGVHMDPSGHSTRPYGLDGVPMDPSGHSTRAYGLDSVPMDPSGHSTRPHGLNSVPMDPSGHSTRSHGLDSVPMDPSGHSTRPYGLNSVPMDPSGHSTRPYGLHSAPMDPSGHSARPYGLHSAPMDPNGPSARPYGLDGVPMDTSGPSTGTYGLDGVPMDPSGNPGQGSSYPNSSEPHVQTGYYDRVSDYGGYGLQYYYPTSYPQ